MSNLNDSFDSIDFTQTLHDRQTRRVYLITYAQANLLQFPTANTFAQKVLEFF